MENSSTFNTILLSLSNRIFSEVVQLCSLGYPLLYSRPAIVLPFLRVLTLLHYLLHPVPAVHCCASAFCSMDLFFFFNLKAFLFVCFLCTLLLRRRGAGKGGTDNALWNRVQSRLHQERWRWLLRVDVFRQGKEEGSVEGTRANVRHFPFCISQRKATLRPPLNVKETSICFCDFTLAHYKLSEHILLLSSFMEFLAIVSCLAFQFAEQFSSSFLCYIECTFY